MANARSISSGRDVRRISAHSWKARAGELGLTSSVIGMRRALPSGGEIPQDCQFEGKDGPVRLSDLFGGHETLVVYSMMYGPDREQGCPMCSALLDAWDGEARHIEQRVALAVVARSPIGRILDYAKARGWTGLRLYPDRSGGYTADYVGERDADMPAPPQPRPQGGRRCEHVEQRSARAWPPL